MATKAFTLSNGLRIPAVGLGTWKSKPNEVGQAVAWALKAGYTHLDCAWIYRNESEIGPVIKDSGIARDKLWVTSKLWIKYFHPNDVEKYARQSIDSLGVGYLDLYLLHWPVALKNIKGRQSERDQALTDDLMPTWRAMESLVEKGLVKSIGISNFNVRKAQKLFDQAKIKPVVNQIEVHPYLPQHELLKWGKDNNVLIEAYSPLGSSEGTVLHDSVVKSIAEKNKKDVGQVLISWAVQRGTVVLPKSVKEHRIAQNLETFELPQEDFDALEHLAEKRGKVERFVRPADASWGDIYEDGTFQEQFPDAKL